MPTIMTTRINFTVDNGFNEKDFAKVCVKMGEGMRLYEQTKTIYDFLLAHKGEEFSPAEIGLSLGIPFAWHCSWDNTDNACVKKIADSLYWLYEMKLIDRHSYTKKVTIDLGYKQRVKDIKIIDGIEYVGYIYKTTMEVDSTSHKWFAL